MVLPFWYRLTQVVLEKRPLNGCSSFVRSCLEVAQFRERVDDDAEDDVQSDGRHEDEERRVVDDEKAELGERVLCRMTHQIL